MLNTIDTLASDNVYICVILYPNVNIPVNANNFQLFFNDFFISLNPLYKKLSIKKLNAININAKNKYVVTFVILIITYLSAIPEN